MQNFEGAKSVGFSCSLTCGIIQEIVRVGNILSLLAGDDVGSVFVGSGLLNTVWLRPGGPVEKEDIGSKLTIRYVFSRCMESKIGCASLVSVCGFVLISGHF